MPETINITLPDGSKREVPKGTTPLDIAKSISPRLADAALVAKIKQSDANDRPPASEQNGDKAPASMHAQQSKDGWQFADLTKPLDQDAELRLLTDRDAEALEVFRHSSAHVLATAVLELFPETKLGHGPPTESGFFYDFYRPTPFTPEDLEKIEKRMQEVVNRDEKFEREYIPREEGLGRFRSEGDFMKVHFIEQFTKPGEPISTYRNGKFVDFCRGPHVPSTGRIKAFKLLNIAGAYWLGDEKNPQLQRIYGTSFFNKKELDQHLTAIEEAKKRDHRVLGQQLDLFSIQELAGPGLIFWHPKGGLVRKEMEDWMRNEYLARGYHLVYTPHVSRVNLWKTSGHEGYYAQNMFTPMELDDADYRMKPMNCPGHILIYQNTLRSYRDLPQRYGELGTVYRYERSGVMHGLLRVRGFTQDDAHIFCTPEQIEDEIVGCIDFALAVLKTFGFSEYQVELSTWDPKDKKNFVGSEENWNLATTSLEKVLTGLKIPYKTIPGEAAFYGPKIDVKLVDAIGRPWQLSTGSGIRRGRWLAQAAGHGASSALRIGRALFRNLNRTLRRSVPGLALACAGGGDPHQRKAHRVRTQSGAAAEECRRACPRGRPQRKNERQGPRTHPPEGPVPAGGGRERSGRGYGERACPRPAAAGRHGPARSICGAREEADCRESGRFNHRSTLMTQI